MNNEKKLEKITTQRLNNFSTSILNAKDRNNETAYYNLAILLFSKYNLYRNNKKKENKNKTLVLRRK